MLWPSWAMTRSSPPTVETEPPGRREQRDAVTRERLGLRRWRRPTVRRCTSRTGPSGSPSRRRPRPSRRGSRCRSRPALSRLTSCWTAAIGGARAVHVAGGRGVCAGLVKEPPCAPDVGGDVPDVGAVNAQAVLALGRVGQLCRVGDNWAIGGRRPGDPAAAKSALFQNSTWVFVSAGIP